MKKEIDKLIKEKQYWKNRCKELTKQKEKDLKFAEDVGVNYGKLERENKKLTERIEQLENPAPMLCEECQEVSCECEETVLMYYIIKGGYYYRPDSKGYTQHKHDAGQYTQEEANKHLNHCDELTIEQISPSLIKTSETIVDPKQMTIEDVINEESEQVECTECNGEGQIYTDTSSSCMTAPSECCGGCGYDSECEACEGKGTVENE